MTPPGAEISGHGQLLVGPTGSGWQPLVGRELARAMLVGAGDDSRVFILRLEPDVDVRLVVVFVRIGSLVCVVRPTDVDGALESELPFALGRRSAVAVVVECESEDEAAELVRRYDAERTAEGGEGAAPPPPVPPLTRSAPPPPPPMSAPPPAAAPSAPPPVPAPREEMPEAAPPEEMPVESAPPEAMPVEAAPPAAEPEPPEPADRRTIAHVHAEMPRRVAVETPVEVRFRLSRRRLEATPGTSSTAQSIRVDPARELTVTIALRGFRLVDESQATVVTRLPASADEVAEHVFTIMAPLTGRGEVSLVVRQDADLPLATLRLTAEIVAADALLEVEPAGVAAEVVEPDPELVALPSIRIDESIVGTDSTLRIRVAVGGEARECTTHLTDKAAFISRTYERIAGIRSELAEITDSVERAQHGRRRLRELGKGLARALFDADVRELLWNAAPDGLDGLIVQTAGEIDIPWEVVHLVPPGGVDDDELRFLSSYGLTRWVYDTAHPTEFHIEPRRVRYVCPDYAEHSLHLTHTAEERRMLEERFAATTIDPDDAGGIAALMHEGFDLLHFAGHGRWNDQSPQAQELLLAGFRAQEEVPLARYSDEELRHDLPDVGSADATAAGPFVFLNACDIGRLPSGPAALGGFPEAFLRGGAAAFVGCSWAVGDDPAATFVDVFYRALADDDATIADATRAARLAAHEEADLSELAYAVYAHPRARMRVERPAPSPHRTAPEGPPS